MLTSARAFKGGRASRPPRAAGAPSGRRRALPRWTTAAAEEALRAVRAEASAREVLPNVAYGHIVLSEQMRVHCMAAIRATCKHKPTVALIEMIWTEVSDLYPLLETGPAQQLIENTWRVLTRRAMRIGVHDSTPLAAKESLGIAPAESLRGTLAQWRDATVTRRRQPTGTKIPAAIAEWPWEMVPAGAVICWERALGHVRDRLQGEPSAAEVARLVRTTVTLTALANPSDVFFWVGEGYWTVDELANAFLIRKASVSTLRRALTDQSMVSE